MQVLSIVSASPLFSTAFFEMIQNTKGKIADLYLQDALPFSSEVGTQIKEKMPDLLLWHLSGSSEDAATQLATLVSLQDALPQTQILVALEHTHGMLLRKILQHTFDYLLLPLNPCQIATALLRVMAQREQQKEQFFLSPSFFTLRLREELLIDLLSQPIPCSVQRYAPFPDISTILHQKYRLLVLPSSPSFFQNWRNVSSDFFLSHFLLLRGEKQTYLLLENTFAPSFQQPIDSQIISFPSLCSLAKWLQAKDIIQTVTNPLSAEERALSEPTLFTLAPHPLPAADSWKNGEDFSRTIDTLFASVQSPNTSFLLSFWLLSSLVSTSKTNDFAQKLLSATTIHEMKNIVVQEFQSHRLQQLTYATQYPNYITQAIALVANHLDNPRLSLHWLAEQKLFINANYFSHQFSLKTGEAFTTFLTRQRIEKAKELLLHPAQYKITYVASLIGLGENPRYFSQLFKKETGVSPTTFRIETTR